MRTAVQLFVRKRIAWMLVPCMMLGAGCAPFHKPGMNDWKSYSLFKAKEQSDTPVPRTKQLTTAEQRKLCITTAEQLARSQHWSECVKLYEKAEGMDKHNPPLDRELAPALAANGQFTESIQRYERLIAKNPKDDELEVNLAWTLMESGNTSMAEENLKKVIARHPNHRGAVVNLATIQATSGRTSDAFETYRSVLRDAASHHNIGLILLESGQIEMAKQAFANASQFSDAPKESKQFLASLQSVVSP